MDKSRVPFERGVATVSRRTVFRAAGAGFGLWLVGSVGGRAVAVEVPRAGLGTVPMAAIPGGTLDPSSVGQFVGYS